MGKVKFTRIRSFGLSVCIVLNGIYDTCQLCQYVSQFFLAKFFEIGYVPIWGAVLVLRSLIVDKKGASHPLERPPRDRVAASGRAAAAPEVADQHGQPLDAVIHVTQR
jgi:hypothetical protein